MQPMDEANIHAARWMAEVAARGSLAGYFAPPLTKLKRSTAKREGWILAVR